jgi:hypothetical protein
LAVGAAKQQPTAHFRQGYCVLVATDAAAGLVQADSFITNQVEVSPMMIQVGAHQMPYLLFYFILNFSLIYIVCPFLLLNSTGTVTATATITRVVEL